MLTLRISRRLCVTKESLISVYADEELEAIKTAMESPLLETTVAELQDVIVNFAGAVGMLEAQQAVEYLKDEAGQDVNVIFGTVNAGFGDQRQ